MKVKLSEITNEMLVSSIPMGKMVSAVAQVKKDSVFEGEIDYCDLLAVRTIYGFVAMLEKGTELDFEGKDIYQIYDELTSLEIFNLVKSNESYATLQQLIDKEINKIETEYKSKLDMTSVEEIIKNRKMPFEDEITELIGSLSKVVENFEDKKFINGVINKVSKLIPKEMLDKKKDGAK